MRLHGISEALAALIGLAVVAALLILVYMLFISVYQNPSIGIRQVELQAAPPSIVFQVVPPPTGWSLSSSNQSIVYVYLQVPAGDYPAVMIEVAVNRSSNETIMCAPWVRALAPKVTSWYRGSNLTWLVEDIVGVGQLGMKPFAAKLEVNISSCPGVNASNAYALYLITFRGATARVILPSSLYYAVQAVNLAALLTKGPSSINIVPSPYLSTLPALASGVVGPYIIKWGFTHIIRFSLGNGSLVALPAKFLLNYTNRVVTNTTINVTGLRVGFMFASRIPGTKVYNLLVAGVTPPGSSILLRVGGRSVPLTCQYSYVGVPYIFYRLYIMGINGSSVVEALDPSTGRAWLTNVSALAGMSLPPLPTELVINDFRFYLSSGHPLASVPYLVSINGTLVGSPTSPALVEFYCAAPPTASGVAPSVPPNLLPGTMVFNSSGVLLFSTEDWVYGSGASYDDSFRFYDAALNRYVNVSLEDSGYVTLVYTGYLLTPANDPAGVYLNLYGVLHFHDSDQAEDVGGTPNVLIGDQAIVTVGVLNYTALVASGRIQVISAYQITYDTLRTYESTFRAAWTPYGFSVFIYVPPANSTTTYAIFITIRDPYSSQSLVNDTEITVLLDYLGATVYPLG